MQDIIRKIVEMDEEARRLKEQAEKEKLESEKSIAETKQKVHDEFIERAKTRAAKTTEAERDALDKSWQETKLIHQEIEKNLKSQYIQNKDKWTDEIVKRAKLTS